MRLFNKSELIIVLGVLLVVGILTFFNIRISLRRSRDFQRKEDINLVANTLYHFHEDFGYYPKATSGGQIIACNADRELVFGLNSQDKIRKDYKVCKWGEDQITDISDPAFRAPLPGDIERGQGAGYYYVSTYDHFQVYASFEGRDEDEFSQSIEKLHLPCGDRICNFGKGSPNTPLDMSLVEYENELNAKK